MKYHLLFLLLWISTYNAQAQWVSINPGAGGQVQDVVPSPNTPNHLLLASDMEGIYESTDNGESWHPKGSLKQNRVYSVAFTPGNTEKIYVGTVYGLEVSNDGGNSSELVEISRKKSVGAIAVDPFNENNILAGIGWRDDYDFANQFGMGTTGNGEIFRSTDGGQNWQVVQYTGNSQDRNVFTILYDAQNQGQVYMGTAQGIFKSTDGGATWSALTKPASVAKNQGIALSPDGTKLYAVFLTSGNNGYLFATPTAEVTADSWIKASEGVKALDFWYPEVDPRSTGNQHKVLLSLRRTRSGLHEATFDWSGNSATYSFEIIWDGHEGYDNGWDIADPNPRYVHYTPANWDRAVWSTSNQTIFSADYADGTYSWNNKYSIPNYDIMVKAPTWGNSLWPCYQGRGTESTYSYDIAVHENYVIQGQGDNGPMESWDGGLSWSNVWHRASGGGSKGQNLSDVQAVTIGDADGTPTVLAQMTEGYGGAIGIGDGRLYGKKLTTHSPDDEWVFLAGGAEQKGGLPTGGADNVLRDVEVSPAKPERVFMFASNVGMFMVDDLGQAMEEGVANVVKISNGVLNNVKSVKKIAPHPTNPDIVYLNGSTGSQGVYKGERTGAGLEDWTWTKIYNGSSWDAEVTTWEYNGQVYVFYFGASSETGSDGSNYIGVLSLDEGESWTKVIDRQLVKTINEPSWYAQVAQDYRFTSKGGIVGYDDQIIVCYYDHRQQKTYGVYKGTIAGASVEWEEWTDNLYFGGFTSARMAADVNGQRHVWISSAGAGSWKRPIEDAGPLPDAPEAPKDLEGQAVGAGQINLSWTDQATNESGFRIERKEAGGDFQQVGVRSANVTSFSDKGLKPQTAYTYRVYAFNAGGQSSFSNESTATTLEGEACASSTLVSNGEFRLDIQDWVLYNEGEEEGLTASTFRVVNDAQMSGEEAAFIEIEKAWDGPQKIQFFSPLTADLEGGVTYRLTFLAKAEQARNIETNVFIATPPWTGFLKEPTAITTQVEQYTFEFTPPTETTNVRVDFFLGNNTANVWIDEVAIRRKCLVEPPFGAPKPPSDLMATSGPQQVALQWYDNADNETGFRIERRTLNSAFEEVAALTADTDNYTDNDLLSETTYEYRIKAYNGTGSSYYSNLIQATTAVGSIPVTAVALEECPAELLEVGEMHQLTYILTPENATEQGVSWSSSDESVLTVSPTGEVQAIAQGQATVTITTVDGEQTDACTIEVKENPPLDNDAAHTDIKLYPNPVTAGELTIIAPAMTQGRVQIFDLTGRLQWQGSKERWVKGVYHIKSLPQSLKGLFFIHIQSENTHWTSRILIQ